MCGRYGLFAELDALAEQFDFDSSMMEDVYTPRWNIPPTTPALTVQSAGANTEGVYRPNTARLLRWGMTGARNPKSKGSGRPLFNAPRGDGAQAADVSAVVQGAALSHPCQRILRVAQRCVRKADACLVSPRGRRAGSIRRHLAERAHSRRRHTCVRHYHLCGERPSRADPPQDARNSASGGLRRMVERGVGAVRPIGAAATV